MRKLSVTSETITDPWFDEVYFAFCFRVVKCGLPRQYLIQNKWRYLSGSSVLPETVQGFEKAGLQMIS